MELAECHMMFCTRDRGATNSGPNVVFTLLYARIRISLVQSICDIMANIVRHHSCGLRTFGV